MTTALDDIKELAGYFNIKSYIKAFKDGAKAVEWPLAKMRLEDVISHAVGQSEILRNLKHHNPTFFAQAGLDKIQDRVEPIASIDIESEAGKAVTLSDLSRFRKITQELQSPTFNNSRMENCELKAA